MADALHYLAFHQPVRQQLQRPTGPSLRSFGAGQRNQVGLPRTIQLLLTPIKLLPSSQCRLNSLIYAAPTHPLHCRNPYSQSPGYLLVRQWALSLILITEQQDAGVSLLISRHTPLGRQGFQFLLFLFRQLHPVFLNHHLNPLPSSFPLGLPLYILPAFISNLVDY